ncbi:MAG: DegT/DnrJ/EryC1/StrS family aminotransferase [Clostridia bacterium]|nr:DegT/DnrJ/EryC1/StrS family aminotransferase [Clostridia bacterium]
MNTPIADFVTKYAKSDATRLHMPGHKGKPILGVEALDITEITGADVLYSADGIIAESENNCSSLFGTEHSFYSAEGSSLAIKAMLYLAITASGDERPLVLAARNAHKAFLYAATWLDFDVQWMMPSEDTHLCSCLLSADDVENAILTANKKPSTVYLTSPDYLGNLADIKEIAKVCTAHKIPLLVDNAHGAYLKFLEKDRHPITLGATMTSDSAHKTLPVLTGGAYLHIAKDADPYFAENARAALASFASTSPSYLILSSLDLCNAYLAETGKAEFAASAKKVSDLKAHLSALGFTLFGNEPLKLCVYAPDYGYFGYELAELLQKHKIESEFADSDYLVLMFSPSNTPLDYERAEQVFDKIVKKERKILPKAPAPILSEQRMSVRKAMLAKSETIPTEQAAGRIAASPTVSCPPAIPIVVSGETITKEVIKCLLHYGINEIAVVKE